MSIHIVSKKIALTDSIRDKIEVTIFTQNGTILRAEDSTNDLYSAIDSVYDKLYKQIRKLKTQLIRKNKSNESIRFNNIDEYIDPNINDNIIKRSKKFNFDKPMTTEDAILQMELLEHKFFVFRNIDSEYVSVVYKRYDGYGLIEQI